MSGRGELVAVRQHASGFGFLLPTSQFGEQIEFAAGEMFCPAMLRKPPTTSCRVSGNYISSRNFNLLVFLLLFCIVFIIFSREKTVVALVQSGQ